MLVEKARWPIGAIDFGSGICPLENEVTTIGRDLDNTICIQSANVSDHHAVIYRIAEGFLLRDLGSTHGTWIGEHAISGDALLGDGDLIRSRGCRRVLHSERAIGAILSDGNIDRHLPSVRQASRRVRRSHRLTDTLPCLLRDSNCPGGDTFSAELECRFCISSDPRHPYFRRTVATRKE